MNKKQQKNLFSKVESECPKCDEHNEYTSPSSLWGEVITQKCAVCGYEYKIEVE